MITYAIHKNATDLKDYFKKHLSKGEYYLENEQTPGKWIGKGLEYLGINQYSQVLENQFQDLLDGNHPVTRENILLRKKKNRISCFDLVFSAPKSVSIMAITMKDNRILEAHEKAVQMAFMELETQARTRVRKFLSASSKESRPTKNLMAARFTHKTSRALDPQLHTHVLTFNMTFDPKENRIKALDAVNMLDKLGVKFATEVYRNTLAKELTDLGYSLEQGRHTWRIKGVPKEVEILFSKRSDQIQEKEEKLSAEGTSVDNAARAAIAYQSRDKKQKDIDYETLVAGQIRQLSQTELSALKAVLTHADPKNNLKSIEQESSQKDIVNYAIEHTFERKSVVDEKELLIAALKRGTGSTDIHSLRNLLSGDQFIRRVDRDEAKVEIMLKEERLREIMLIEFIRQARGKHTILGESSNLPTDLSHEQKEVVKNALNSKDQILFFRGAAGVGKTTTLKTITQNVGTPIRLSAPTSSAAEKLREEGFKESITTQMLLTKKDQIQKRDLLIVDEAGLLSTKVMAQLFEIASEKEARILLVGDTLQHNSVEGGDALRLLEKYSLVHQLELGKIRRQKQQEYLKAIQEFSEGNSHKGFEILQKMGVVHEVGEKRSEKVAQEYVRKMKDGPTLVVTPTWEEHDKVTQAIREELKKEKLLENKDHPVQIFRSLNFTQAEKKFAKNFENGAYVSFHSSVSPFLIKSESKSPDDPQTTFRQGKFKQGEVWKVISTTDQKVTLERGGEVKTLIPKLSWKTFDIVEKKAALFSIGDVVLTKANFASSKINRIVNGTLSKIRSLEKDGTIHLENGKYFTPEFRHFVHGYTLTSQSSQGKDAKHVIISANTKQKDALSKNQAYVSFSRGVESIEIYTDDVLKFKDAIQKESNRKLVLERLSDGILKQKFLKLKLETKKRIEMGRDLVERAFIFFYFKKRQRENILREKNLNK